MSKINRSTLDQADGSGGVPEVGRQNALLGTSTVVRDVKRSPAVRPENLRTTHKSRGVPAAWLLFKVGGASDHKPVPVPELFCLLKEHLEKPIKAGNDEPTPPPVASVLMMEKAAAFCRSMNPELVPLGAELMLNGLYALASNGYTLAQQTLLDLAIHASNLVKNLCLTHADDMRQFARGRYEWPSTISFHSDWQSENEKLIADIALGEDSPMKEKIEFKRVPAEAQPYRHILFMYCQRLLDVVDAVRSWAQELKYQPTAKRKNRGRRQIKSPTWGEVSRQLRGTHDWVLKAVDLPEFEPGSAGAMQWLEVGWQGFEAVTQGHPESLPGLWDVGEFRAKNRRRKSQAFKKHRGKEAPLPPLNPKYVSEGAHERLKDTFKNWFGPKAKQPKAEQLLAS